MIRHRVGGGEATALVHRVLFRQIITRGRLIAMSLLGISIVVFGWAVGASDAGLDFEVDRLDRAVGIVTDIGFAIVVPVVALVFASGTLGDTREDGTLVYLWLRPLDRWPIAVGAATAALTVVVPLTVMPVVATAIVLDVGNGLIAASLLAAVVGVIGYVGVFVLLGSWVRNPIVWGLAYIIVWEGIAAAVGTAPSRVAIRGYTRSIIADRTGVDLSLAGVAPAWAIVMPLLIGFLGLAIAAWRLDRLDVA